VICFVKAYLTAQERQNHYHNSGGYCVSVCNAPTLLIAPTIATSVGYAAAQQPDMDASLRLLQDAHHELEHAMPNKGGHRERALALIDQAIGQVRDGIEFAAHH
jgi:hypothetical protein